MRKDDPLTELSGQRKAAILMVLLGDEISDLMLEENE